MQRTDKAALGRRDVLRTLGAMAGAGVATATLSAAAVADGEGHDDKRKARYRATDHVKRFYDVNRYPTTK